MKTTFVALVLIATLTACSKPKETGSAASSAASASAANAAADAAFWKWFVAHKDEVAAVKRADEPIADELAAQLRKIDKDVTFELAVATKDRELIVSAGGIRSAFPAVKRLVAAAPTIEGWTIIAFRPRKVADFTVELGDGTSLAPAALTFRALGAAKGKVGIAIYVEGANPVSQQTKTAVYLLLDAALGELDVETRLGEIDIKPAPAPAGARPFRELPKVVDEATR
jgi:hypothetical protein